MSDPLYAKDLLRLAAAATAAGRLDPFDVEGIAHNATCGDRVGVTLCLDSSGRIAAIAHDTRACVLAQASAAILGGHLHGKTQTDVEGLRHAVARMLEGGPAPASPFADYAKLAAAATFRSRHRCVLLPIDAVLEAFSKRAKA